MKLVKERWVTVRQTALNLDVHENVFRKWVRELIAHPQSALPSGG